MKRFNKLTLAVAMMLGCSALFAQAPASVPATKIQPAQPVKVVKAEPLTPATACTKSCDAEKPATQASIVQLVAQRREFLAKYPKAHGEHFTVEAGKISEADAKKFGIAEADRQIDAPGVNGVIHSHQVGNWQDTATRIKGLVDSTGIVGFGVKEEPTAKAAPAPLPKTHAKTLLPYGISQGVMILVCLGLIYLAIVKEFEPLLLLPIGFGGLLANIPFAGVTAAPILDTMGGVVEPGGFLYYTFEMGVSTGLFPILIFMGVGAMTDFGPLIANPRTAILGAAAQAGIFFALIGALALTIYLPGINFFLTDAASIGIIGGADGPTAIWLTTKLAPDLLGAIAVAAYSYMALVPIIQPPIMKLLVPAKDRKIKMSQLRHVSKMEKVIFPISVVILCALLLPSATPLLGALMLGNLAKESGVVDRISDTMANSLCNIVTILLGISVGSKLAAEKFLNMETIGILLLGLVAFSIGTATGCIMARVMNVFSKNKINPLIGAAGVSAVPMAARVANKVGLQEDPTNFLLMHAMGPNVAGVIGSAVVAGVLYFCCR